MSNSLLHFAVVAIAVGWTLGAAKHSPGQRAYENSSATQLAAQESVSERGVQPSPGGTVTDPVADPKAVVILGKARFTVLTPELIRMEWAADGKFEDHASFVFLNRRLPAPGFDRTESDHGHRLTLKTSALTLTYTPAKDGRFTPEDLTIELTVDGKQVI